jgi:hypothetical protein
MQSKNVYRPEAVKRYIDSIEKTVLPKNVAPPVFVILWVLFGVTILALVFILTINIPLYIQESVIVIRTNPNEHAALDSIGFILLLSAQTYKKVNSGDVISIIIQDKTISGIVTKIDSTSDICPNLWQYICFNTVSEIRFNTPKFIAYGKLLHMDKIHNSSQIIGRIFKTNIEIGSRSLATYVPVIGQYFRENYEDVTW